MAALRKLWLWGPVVGHMALIFILSSFSRLPGPPAGLSDKHVHAFTFGLLAALWVRARSGGRLCETTWRAAVEGIAVATLWGASDEFHQWFVPGRTADPADLAADAAGALVAGAALMACAIIARPARPSDAHVPRGRRRASAPPDEPTH